MLCRAWWKGEGRFLPGLGLSSGYTLPGWKLWLDLGSSLALPQGGGSVILCSLVVSSVIGRHLCEGDSGGSQGFRKSQSVLAFPDPSTPNGGCFVEERIVA